MKRTTSLPLILLLFVFKISFGQWNVQTGYDFGFFRTDYQGSEALSTEEDSHNLHRINVKLEYQFKNNFLVSLNTGANIHNVSHDLKTIKNTNFDGNSVVRHRTSIHNSTLQTYRIGLSIGYNFSINNSSSVIVSVNYNQFFFNKVTNKRSLFITNYYLSSDGEKSDPIYTENEYQDMIDLDEIGYRNKFKKENKHLVFSLGYRHQIRDFFINPTLGLSLLNNSLVKPEFIIPKRQTLFLFGLNIGYTFS